MIFFFDQKNIIQYPKKINTVIALKLDRFTRSIYDWEEFINFLDENGAYIGCVNDDINTTTANGKMF